MLVRECGLLPDNYQVINTSLILTSPLIYDNISFEIQSEYLYIISHGDNGTRLEITFLKTTKKCIPIRVLSQGNVIFYGNIKIIKPHLAIQILRNQQKK